MITGRQCVLDSDSTRWRKLQSSKYLAGPPTISTVWVRAKTKQKRRGWRAVGVWIWKHTGLTMFREKASKESWAANHSTTPANPNVATNVLHEKPGKWSSHCSLQADTWQWSRRLWTRRQHPDSRMTIYMCESQSNEAIVYINLHAEPAGKHRAVNTVCVQCGGQVDSLWRVVGLGAQCGITYSWHSHKE